MDDLIGKHIVIFYRDGERVIRKEVTVSCIENGLLLFKKDGSHITEGLPLSSIVRFEIINGGAPKHE